MLIKDFCPIAEVASYYYLPDGEEREKKKETVLTEVLPLYLDRFEKQVASNKGYLVIGKVIHRLLPKLFRKFCNECFLV